MPRNAAEHSAHHADHDADHPAGEHVEFQEQHLELDYLKQQDLRTLTGIFEGLQHSLSHIDEQPRHTAAATLADRIFEPLRHKMGERFADPDDYVNRENRQYRRFILDYGAADTGRQFANYLANPSANPENLARLVQKVQDWGSSDHWPEPRQEDYYSRTYVDQEFALHQADLRDLTRETPGSNSLRDDAYIEALHVRGREAVEDRSRDFTEDHALALVADHRAAAHRLISAYEGIPPYQADDAPQLDFPPEGAKPSEVGQYLTQFAAAFPEVRRDWPALYRSAWADSRLPDDTASWPDHARQKAAVFHAMVYRPESDNADATS